MREARTQKRKPRVEFYVFAGLCALSFVSLLFSTRSFFVDFRDAGLSVFSGLRQGLHSVFSHAARIANSVQELARLQREYIELTEQLERYEILEQSAAEIRQENYRLREQLDISNTLQYRYIVAEISGRDPDNLFSAFSINKGKRQGIEAGMSVAAYQGGTQALVGKVAQSGQTESLIMPVYGASTFVSARFAASRYEGIVGGQGSIDQPLLMRFIPKSAYSEINTGDVIITSGLGGVYPAGINIGRVGNLSPLEGASAIEIEVIPSIDFSRLEYVFVLSREE